MVNFIMGGLFAFVWGVMGRGTQRGGDKLGAKVGKLAKAAFSWLRQIFHYRIINTDTNF